VSEAEWWVYMLECCDGSFYTGVATDVDRRLAEHLKGTASKYTRSRAPLSLVYQEPTRTRSAALKREAQIKRLSRPGKLSLIAAQQKAP
jgi:putative endonuclease